MFNQEAKTMFGWLASEIEDRKCDPANSWIRGAHNCTLYLVSKKLVDLQGTVQEVQEVQAVQDLLLLPAWHPAGDCY